MPSKKKIFTSADGAVERLFTQCHEKPTNDTKDTHLTNIAKHTQDANHTHIYNVSKPTNKSKHYDERGKRSQRFGLLLDECLKKDLIHLSRATGGKSMNDYIVTILLHHVELEENKEKLDIYRKLLQD
jgi:hypothetical protein